MADTIKVKELGKSENNVSGALAFNFMRKDVEGKTPEQIRQLVLKHIMELGKNLFALLMGKKKQWEKETEELKRFLGKDH